MYKGHMDKAKVGRFKVEPRMGGAGGCDRMKMETTVFENKKQKIYNLLE